MFTFREQFFHSISCLSHLGCCLSCRTMRRVVRTMKILVVKLRHCSIGARRIGTSSSYCPKRLYSFPNGELTVTDPRQFQSWCKNNFDMLQWSLCLSPGDTQSHGQWLRTGAINLEFPSKYTPTFPYVQGVLKRTLSPEKCNLIGANYVTIKRVSTRKFNC